MKEEIIESIHAGGVGVIPTDTIYGIVASAHIPDAVERVYAVKGHDPQKACIVLISSIEDVEHFGVVLSDELREQLSGYWPGPYSVLLPTMDETYEYLDRGTGEIAFRLPDDSELLDLLEKTGPLIAPSANPEGDVPATNVDAVRRYFGTSIDFCVDGGERDERPSTLIRFSDDGEPQILRG